MNAPKIRMTFFSRLLVSMLCFLPFVLLQFRSVMANPIAVQDIARIDSLSSLSLSRDGDYMVGLIALGDNPEIQKYSIAVWDPRDLSKPPLISNPDGNVEFVRAVAMKAGKILVVARVKWVGGLRGCGEGKSIGSTRTYITKVFVTDTKFSKFEEPFSAKRKGRLSQSRNQEIEELCMSLGVSAGIADMLPLDPENVIISRIANLFNGNRQYIKYNLVTGASKKLYENSGGYGVSLIDSKTGLPLAKVKDGYKDGSFYDEISLYNKNTGTFEAQKPLENLTKNRTIVEVLDWDEQSGSYYILTNQFSDKYQIYKYDPILKKYEDKPLFFDDQFDIGSIILSGRADDYGHVLGYRIRDAISTVKWLDPQMNAIKAGMERRYPDKNAYFIDWNYDRSLFLVGVSGSDQPPLYFLISSNGKSIKYLGANRAFMKDYKLAKTELIYYKARDGKSIPGLLTMPVGWKKGDPPPPAIIHPHGGPWARDYANWDASGWVPFLTSRGYAVLQPQYRGSAGWGYDLWESGDAEWGKKMQDDKDDGALWMVANGYADRNRMAIFGYSYGGFAAFSAAVRPGGPYQCAIAGAGVSDLGRLGSTWSRNPRQRKWQGRTVKGMDPIKYTHQVDLPMLILHGDRDVRVPLYHAKDFYNKIKDKVDAKLVVIEDMPHSLPWTPKMQMRFLTEMEDYLENDCFR